MNLVVIKENLKKGLNAVARAANENSQLPILKNVLVETTKNKISLIATNLEIAITYSVLGKVIEPGKITVPLNLFLNLINAIQSERINISLKNNFLEITSDNYKAKIQGSSAEDFPIIPKIKETENFIEIEEGFLKDAFLQTSLATQFSEIRQELNGILMSYRVQDMVFAATDSFRLAEKTIGNKHFNSNFGSEFTCLIPLKTANELIKILGEDGKVKIYKDDNQMLFQTEQWECISRLQEGKFPDYKQIIPKKFSSEISLNRAEFIDAVKLTSVLSSRINEITIKNNESKFLEVFSADEAVGENNYLLPAKIQGNFKQISFNWKYLNDGLKALKGEEAHLGMNEENKPAIIRSSSDASYFYILMPFLKA